MLTFSHSCLIFLKQKKWDLQNRSLLCIFPNPFPFSQGNCYLEHFTFLVHILFFYYISMCSQITYFVVLYSKHRFYINVIVPNVSFYSFLFFFFTQNCFEDTPILICGTLVHSFEVLYKWEFLYIISFYTYGRVSLAYTPRSKITEETL